MQNIAAAHPDFLIDLGDTFSLDGATESEATVRQKYLDQRGMSASSDTRSRSYLPGDGTNASVGYTYNITSCAARDGDSDGTNDCDDGCPADPGKVAAGACGCGVADTDANQNGTPDCLETCAGATLASNDADGVAPVGTAVRWTAGAQCGGGGAMYQFRMQSPFGGWKTVRSYATSNTFDWATSGLFAGTYHFAVWVRRPGSTQQYETQATTSFVLQRRR